MDSFGTNGKTDFLKIHIVLPRIGSNTVPQKIVNVLISRSLLEVSVAEIRAELGEVLLQVWTKVLLCQQQMRKQKFKNDKAAGYDGIVKEHIFAWSSIGNSLLCAACFCLMLRLVTVSYLMILVLVLLIYYTHYYYLFHCYIAQHGSDYKVTSSPKVLLSVCPRPYGRNFYSILMKFCTEVGPEK